MTEIKNIAVLYKSWKDPACQLLTWFCRSLSIRIATHVNYTGLLSTLVIYRVSNIHSLCDHRRFIDLISSLDLTGSLSRTNSLSWLLTFLRSYLRKSSVRCHIRLDGVLKGSHEWSRNNRLWIHSLVNMNDGCRFSNLLKVNHSLKQCIPG